MILNNINISNFILLEKKKEKKGQLFLGWVVFYLFQMFDKLRPLKEIVVCRGIRELVLWSNCGIPHPHLVAGLGLAL